MSTKEAPPLLKVERWPMVPVTLIRLPMCKWCKQLLDGSRDHHCMASRREESENRIEAAIKLLKDAGYRVDVSSYG